MDSNVRRLAIGLFAVLALLVLILVYAGNADKIKRLTSKGSVADSAASESVAELSAGYGGQIGDNLKGFMADQDFFDEPDVLASVYEADVTALTLDIKPGEGRIQVSIKNGRGGLETGQKFSVTLARQDDWTILQEDIPESAGVPGGQGAEPQEPDANTAATGQADFQIFTDDDRNGQILMEDLEVGTYVVTLMEQEGYHVPSRGTIVKVSEEKVEVIEIGGQDSGAGASTLPQTGYGPSGAGLPGAAAGQTVMPGGNDSGVDASAAAMKPGQINPGQ